MRKTRLLILLSLCSIALPAFSQEVLLSETERYYDFLALDGLTERPYLNYRTLSDSRWTIQADDGVWGETRLGGMRGATETVAYRVYGPALFTSYNSAAPYGQNDGLLWQGKGLNASLSGGFRLEAYGFELTLKPELVFSQNLSFDLIASTYSGATYSGKADTYGYYGVHSLDAPQRFGDDPIVAFGWGDSELRYTYKYLTTGFGTQSPWLGPGRVNAIMHSNNAPPYPKLDIGLRRMPLTILGWYAGDLEARLWAGYLSESDYFDNDDTNGHNLISALAVAFAPSLLPGLTLFANRSYLSKWEASSWQTIPRLFFVNLDGGGAQDEADQRASLGFDYLLPVAGVEVYGEAGINDYGPSLDGYIRYPFHSMVYTGGLRKSVRAPLPDGMRGEITFEWTNLEASQDFQFQWPTSFYAHWLISQGYTNGGQWLGAGIGTGGNSQYLGFRLYYPKGSTNIYVYRVNPDNDYLYQLTVLTTGNEDRIADFKAVLSLGLQTEYFVSDSLFASLGLVYAVEHNPLYESVSWGVTEKRHNFRLEAALTWML